MPPFRTLFVCMGNICRSPAGEAVFRAFVEREGLADRIECDSAGTIGYHSGSAPDSRMRQEGKRRGIPVNGRARQVRAQDLQDFDLVLAMDDSNLDYLRELEAESPGRARIEAFCVYVTDSDATEVPDPYYGGPEGFAHVFDLLEDGCAELLRSIRAQLA